ncbi:hypothetical protein CK224_25480 [Mesorhizobium sp. WSM3862]|nr:hypothetical protein CK224_25480 [Mesorhizobium sp. WSM3862]
MSGRLPACLLCGIEASMTRLLHVKFVSVLRLQLPIGSSLDASRGTKRLFQSQILRESDGPCKNHRTGRPRGDPRLPLSVLPRRRPRR